MSKDYNKYKELMTQIADVQYASAVLGWDQETYMPSKGAGFRAQQLATLAGISHEQATSKVLGDLLTVLTSQTSLGEKENRNIKQSLKNYNDSKKYTTAFVQELSKTVSETFQAWQKAKEANNFSLYAPHLEKLVKLKREECKLLGYKAHPYDALLDQYEPGAKTADLEILFTDVRKQLVDFVKQIRSKPQNKDSFMFLNYNKQKQWDFGIHLLKQMGYDFEAGRQDVSSHPFTTSFSSEDVRVTTRINEQDINEMIWSCIHEGGHALYEQGLPASEYGLPSGEPISLGIHESQSRLWENNVGRGLPYWKANYKELQQAFPENLQAVTFEAFYKAMNIVKPSLIRTSADELTYHFHVLIRFEIEKALIEGLIEVKDLPEYWNKKYKEYLGIDVPSDTLGVLQDIHWSHGSFGYFPTYSLGSFYAAQFFAQAKKEIVNLEKEIENGNLKPLLIWLREKIHKHGKYYSSEELCISITGEKLDFKYFMEYAKIKYSALYQL
ncbi:MAG: carboxypeptidase M32 [Bacteroidetes bacterium]|nr:carboxypeptidase M32 [Bacteroidota bacterium]